MRPLAGLRVLEFDAIGPVPFCGMMLADHGAEITRVLRPGGQPGGVDAGAHDPLLRGRSRQVALDLKSEAGRMAALDLAAEAQILIEGHRPGVMERLGLGPKACHARNPTLVYGRVTGYGQSGPLAGHAGHDINYVARTGALHAIGDADRPPPPPLSLVGDFGGGGMMAAFGLVAAAWQAERTGRGATLDIAMIDGTALLTALTWGWREAGLWRDERGANLLDGGAPFYRCYACADGRYLAVGAIEPRFYLAFRAAFDLHEPIFDAQMDRDLWPAMRAIVAERVAARPRDGWSEAFADPLACVTPVLSWDEVCDDPQVAARGTHVSTDTGVRVAPAPRLEPP